MKHFKMYELVDEKVYNLHGEASERFFDTRLLETIDKIREELKKPITINTWKHGGGFSQRGLRHNMSQIVKSKNRIYLSGHVLGKAVDFDVEGMTAKEVREWIILNDNILPYGIRLEKNVNWVHLDVATIKDGVTTF